MVQRGDDSGGGRMSDDVKRLAEAKKHLDKASDLQVEIVAI